MNQNDDYTPNFKAQMVMRMLRNHDDVSKIEKEYGIPSELLVEWRDKFIRDAPTAYRYVSHGVDEEKEDVNDAYMVKIRQLRIHNGYSQREIAAFLGVAQNMYARYENGRSQMPVRFVKKLAIFYGVASDDILGMDVEG